MSHLAKSGTTKRAADFWESAASRSIFLASGFFCSQTVSQPAQNPLTQTVSQPLKFQRHQRQSILKESTSRTLQDLIEKANKLKRYGLEKHIVEIGSGFRGQQSEDGSWVFEFDIPDEKELDASLFTLRLFTQQKEAFSFHRLDRLLKDDGLSASLRTSLSSLRNEYFSFLQAYPTGIEPGFFEPEVHLTNGDIFSVVLNGEMSHTNDPRKRERFQFWTRDGIRLNVLLQAFARIVLRVLLFIYQMAELCEQELAVSYDKKAG